MKYEGRELDVGERIKVFINDETKDCVYNGTVDIHDDTTGEYLFTTPSFIEGEERYYGFECWWVPAKEESKIREEVDNESIKEW